MAAVIEKLVVEQLMDIRYGCANGSPQGHNQQEPSQTTTHWLDEGDTVKAQRQTQKGKKVRLTSVDKKATTLHSVTKLNLQLQVAHPLTQTHETERET